MKPATAKLSTSNDNTASQNVQVIVRCRPTNQNELSQEIVVKTNTLRKEVYMTQKMSTGKEAMKTFTFDHVFGPQTSQKELFDSAVKHVVDEVLMGYNCTIFAYGQTSTGKTFTMEGARDAKTKAIIDIKAGVIPRSVNYIFSTLDALNAEYTIKISVLELYNEELQDLLADEAQAAIVPASDDKKLRIFDDISGKKGTVVSGLEETVVKNATHVMQVLDRAATKRQIAETDLNKSSSRSHLITTVTIHIRETTEDGEELVKTGKLNLVDLAGSENIGRSGAKNQRAKEAGMINQSLLTLGRVITALCQHQPHVPYRESKLTRLLQDSLGGKTKTCIIATISPSITCLEETMSTLEYAYRAKNIQNKPEINVKIAKGALIGQLATDIEKLKMELQSQRDKSGVFLSAEQFKDMSERALSQANLITEQEARMEMQRKNMEELEEQYNISQFDLSKEREEHYNTKQMLQEANLNLEEQKNANSKLHSRIGELEYLIQQRNVRENKLNEEIRSLVDALKGSQQDIVLLEQKMERKDAVENTNAVVHAQYKETVEKELHNLSDEVARFKASQLSASTEFSTKLQEMKTNSSQLFDQISLELKEMQTSMTQQQAQIRNTFTEFKNNQFESYHNQQMADTIHQFRNRVEEQFKIMDGIVADNLQAIYDALTAQADSLKQVESFLQDEVLAKQQQVLHSFVDAHDAQVNQFGSYLINEFAANVKQDMAEQRKAFEDMVTVQLQQATEFKRQLLTSLAKQIEAHEVSQQATWGSLTSQFNTKIDTTTSRLVQMETKWQSDAVSALKNKVHNDLQAPLDHVGQLSKETLVSRVLPNLRDNVASMQPIVAQVQTSVREQCDPSSTKTLAYVCQTELPSSLIRMSRQHQEQFTTFYDNQMDMLQKQESSLLNTVNNKIQPLTSDTMPQVAKQMYQSTIEYSTACDSQFKQVENHIHTGFVFEKAVPQLRDYANRLKRDRPDGDSPDVSHRNKKRRLDMTNYVFPSFTSDDELLSSFRNNGATSVAAPANVLAPIDINVMNQPEPIAAVQEEKPMSPIKKLVYSPTKAKQPITKKPQVQATRGSKPVVAARVMTNNKIHARKPNKSVDSDSLHDNGKENIAQ